MAIELLTQIDQVTGATYFAVNINGQDYRVSSSSVLAYVLANIPDTDIQEFETQYAAPSATGFSVQIASETGNSHLIVTPTAGFAAGTIVLPSSGGAVDRQMIMVNCTQSVGTLTIDGNGATVTGAPSSLSANQFFALKYDAPTTTWYRTADGMPNPITPDTPQTLSFKTLIDAVLVSAELGTPDSGVLTNCTGLPVATGIAGLAAGIAAFLAAPSSANLAAALTDETGSGAAVFANGPSLVAPALGTPASGTLTNCAGLPISTGVAGLAANIAAFLAAPSSANLAAALTDETGTGANVFANGPTLVAPALGTPASGVLSNCTGLPVSTGIAGLAANIAAFLASPTSANLAAAMTDETGTGAAVFATSPTLVTPNLGVATATSLTLTNGQLAFPPAQVPSANPNILDDYEEGTWTPILTFDTPGDLVVAYSVQNGYYTKIGREVMLRFAVTTSTFTHTTSTGQLRITGLPFTAASLTGSRGIGALTAQGITKASYTMFTARVTDAAASVDFLASGSGQALDLINTGDVPTGGTVILQASFSYIAA